MESVINELVKKKNLAHFLVAIDKLITGFVLFCFKTQLVEINMDVDQKWHRHFVGRGANVLHEIQDQCGGVIVSFPKQNTGSTKVIIKGGKECVESAKKRIQEIVDDLVNFL